MCHRMSGLHVYPIFANVFLKMSKNADREVMAIGKIATSLFYGRLGLVG